MLNLRLELAWSCFHTIQIVSEIWICNTALCVKICCGENTYLLPKISHWYPPTKEPVKQPTTKIEAGENTGIRNQAKEQTNQLVQQLKFVSTWKTVCLPCLVFIETKNRSLFNTCKLISPNQEPSSAVIVRGSPEFSSNWEQRILLLWAMWKRTWGII